MFLELRLTTSYVSFCLINRLKPKKFSLLWYESKTAKKQIFILEKLELYLAFLQLSDFIQPANYCQIAFCWWIIVSRCYYMEKSQDILLLLTKIHFCLNLRLHKGLFVITNPSSDGFLDWLIISLFYKCQIKCTTSLKVRYCHFLWQSEKGKKRKWFKKH